MNERVDYKTLHAEMIAALETQDKWVAVRCCCAACMPDGRTQMQEPGCRALLLQARVAHGGLLLCWLRRWPVGELQQQAAPLFLLSRKSSLLEATLLEKDAQLEAVQTRLQVRVRGNGWQVGYASGGACTAACAGDVSYQSLPEKLCLLA